MAAEEAALLCQELSPGIVSLDAFGTFDFARSSLSVDNWSFARAVQVPPAPAGGGDAPSEIFNGKKT